MTVLFAEKGSNLEQQQQAYIHFWMNALARFLIFFSVYIRSNYLWLGLLHSRLSSTDGDVNCSLEDILVFISGTSAVPLLGFLETSTLSFTNGNLATSSTCDIQLHLPLHKAETIPPLRTLCWCQ